jgi:plastocyanin
MARFRLLAIAMIAVAAACGNSTGYGSSPPPPPPPAPPPPPPGGHSTTITVSNNKFTPTPDTIPHGTITFQWAADAVTHNVTWDTGPAPLPAGSGNLGAGASYQATLTVGTYTFHCTIHGLAMSGTIVSQ